MTDPTNLPVGAIVASALMAANISCDSGEDVDRFLDQLVERGYWVATIPEAGGREGLDEEAALALAALNEAIRTAAMLRTETVTIQAPLARYLRAALADSQDAPTDHDHHFDKRCDTCKYLAAASGDATGDATVSTDPLRKALTMCVEALYGRESVSDAIEAARAALAYSQDAPTAADLRGLAPSITGGLSSEGYVRSIRDAASGDAPEPPA